MYQLVFYDPFFLKTKWFETHSFLFKQNITFFQPIPTFNFQERLEFLKKAMSKVIRAKEDIDLTVGQMSELEPLLTKAKSEAFFAEKRMKEAQEVYLKVKKECVQQSQDIEALRIPCQQMKEETVKDFEQVSKRDFR